MTCSCGAPVNQCDICRETWMDWDSEHHAKWCPANPAPLAGDPAIPCRCGGHFVKRNGRNGTFYGCSRFPSCSHTASVEDIQYAITRARIAEESKRHRHPCPRCGAAQRKRSGMCGLYWSCRRCKLETPIYCDCED